MRKISWMVMYLLCIISMLFFMGCGKQEQSNVTDADAAEAVIHSFLGELKENAPENRDMDKIFQMIHYENNQEAYQEIRKDSLQNKVVQDFKIMDVCKLDTNLYCVTVEITSNLDTEENKLYAAKLNESWKVVLGTHNIPTTMLAHCQQNHIEIPVSPLPDGTQCYPVGSMYA